MLHVNKKEKSAQHLGYPVDSAQCLPDVMFFTRSPHRLWCVGHFQTYEFPGLGGLYAENTDLVFFLYLWCNLSIMSSFWEKNDILILLRIKRLCLSWFHKCSWKLFNVLSCRISFSVIILFINYRDPFCTQTWQMMPDGQIHLSPGVQALWMGLFDPHTKGYTR